MIAEIQESPFIIAWDHYMDIGTMTCVAISILVFLYHEFRVMTIKDYKEKYDYVNLNEVRFFWYTAFMLIVAFAFYANSIFTERIITKGMLWFYVRIFLTVSFVTIGYFVFLQRGAHLLSSVCWEAIGEVTQHATDFPTR